MINDKEHISKWKSFLTKGNLYLAHALVFVVPFYNKAERYFIILFLVTNLLAVPLKDRWALMKERKKFILLFSSIYLLYLIGYMYSTDLAFASRQLELKIMLFLMPFIVLGSRMINRINIYGILKTYSIAATLAAAFCLIYAFFHFIKTGDYNVFYYSYFSVYHHTTYFALYLNTAIAFFMLFIFHAKEKVPLWYYVSLIILIVSVYQTASRAGIFTMIMLILYLIGFIVFPKLKWKKTLFSILLVIGASLAVIIPGNGVKNRLDQAFSAMNEENIERQGSASVRLLMWSSAIKLVKEKPILGYGTGDAKDVMIKEFEKDGVERAYKGNYNSHNQYLETWLSVGILGVISLLLIFFIPSWIALKKGTLFYPLYAFLLSVNFLTESMLERQGGVMFMAIFGTFLFFTLYRKKPANV